MRCWIFHRRTAAAPYLRSEKYPSRNLMRGVNCVFACRKAMAFSGHSLPIAMSFVSVFFLSLSSSFHCCIACYGYYYYSCCLSASARAHTHTSCKTENVHKMPFADRARACVCVCDQSHYSQYHFSKVNLNAAASQQSWLTVFRFFMRFYLVAAGNRYYRRK